MSNRQPIGFNPSTAQETTVSAGNLSKWTMHEYMGRAMLIVAALVHEQIIPFNQNDSNHLANFEYSLNIVAAHLKYFNDCMVYLDQNPTDHVPCPLIKIEGKDSL